VNLSDAAARVTIYYTMDGVTFRIYVDVFNLVEAVVQSGPIREFE